METLCVGEILWDLLPSGAKEGGAPMNVAIHMKKLGHDARFAGESATTRWADHWPLF